MYGAILGDIVGSRFEFDRPGWTKEFELLTDECNWTDDTVMTIAIAEALLSAGKDAAVSEIEAACIKSMRKWGNKYPGAGFGGRFYRWLGNEKMGAYGSFGNGSAMRVSAAGWLYDSIERTREVARATANVTHNHPEGIKGAECTAAVIWLARLGVPKDKIRYYVIKEFGYDFSESLEEMRARHRMDESCMDALPKALRSFFDGESTEDVIRNAVSLGGDTDTIAAIAGSMAEAFYGMPILYRGEVLARVEDDMRDVLKAFDKAQRVCEENVMSWADPDEEDEFIDNLPVIAAYEKFYDESDERKKSDLFIEFMNALFARVADLGTVPAPFVDVNGDFFSQMDLEKLRVGDGFTIKNPVSLKLDTMKDPEGDVWIPLFFNNDQISSGETGNIISTVKILDILQMGLNRDDVQGVVINPFEKPFTIRKNMLYHFIRDCVVK